MYFFYSYDSIWDVGNKCIYMHWMYFSRCNICWDVMIECYKVWTAAHDKKTNHDSNLVLFYAMFCSNKIDYIQTTFCSLLLQLKEGAKYFRLFYIMKRVESCCILCLFIFTCLIFNEERYVIIDFQRLIIGQSLNSLLV